MVHLIMENNTDHGDVTNLVTTRDKLDKAGTIDLAQKVANKDQMEALQITEECRDKEVLTETLN